MNGLIHEQRRVFCNKMSSRNQNNNREEVLR